MTTEGEARSMPMFAPLTAAPVYTLMSRGLLLDIAAGMLEEA